MQEHLIAARHVVEKRNMATKKAKTQMLERKLKELKKLQVAIAKAMEFDSDDAETECGGEEGERDEEYCMWENSCCDWISE